MEPKKLEPAQSQLSNTNLENAALHFQRVLKCSKFIVTGSYALNVFGLIDKVKDLDILLVDPSAETLDTLARLSEAPESMHLKLPESSYPQSLCMTRIMYNGIKIDFFYGAGIIEQGHLTLANGLNLSTVPGIVLAKKNANRLKDWLQLRDIAESIFTDIQFNSFLRDKKNYK